MGHGVTKRQIQNAPKNAYYVWPTADLGYPRSLAEFLKRTDLTFVSIGWLEPRNLIGNMKRIVIDHEAITRLRTDQHMWLDHYNKCNGFTTFTPEYPHVMGELSSMVTYLSDKD